MSCDDLLMLYHQCMEHTSYDVLCWVYPHLFEKVDKSKLVCDACEFDKLIRRSYVNSGHRISHTFDIIH